jgi:hypothetical protein
LVSFQQPSVEIVEQWDTNDAPGTGWKRTLRGDLEAFKANTQLCSKYQGASKCTLAQYQCILLFQDNDGSLGLKGAALTQSSLQSPCREREEREREEAGRARWLTR